MISAITRHHTWQIDKQIFIPMLLSTMNYREINKAFMQDHEKLLATTVQRLLDEYNRERKKLRISKEKTYFKTYPIKTKSKNIRYH